jgi:PAS domain S-box-containing protein
MPVNTFSPQKRNSPSPGPVVFNIPVTIALVLLVIFSTIAVVLTIAFYHYEKQELQQYIRTQFIALADGLSPLVHEALQSKDYLLIQKTLQIFSQHNEIAFAVVVDADSLIVAGAPEAWLNRPFREFLAKFKLKLAEIPQPNTFTTFPSASPQQHLFLFDRQFHAPALEASHRGASGTLRGRLLLGYDSRFVESLVGERLRNILILGGLILLLGAAAFYLVVHIFLIRPLRSMSQVMLEVADGNLSARCPNFTGLPEVARLMHQFNGMLAVRMMVEETLAHSEARFRSVVGAAQDAIIAIDQQHRVTLFNRAAERIFGYAATDIVGDSVARLFPSAARQTLAGFIGGKPNPDAKDTSHVHELQAQHQNGTLFPIELTIASASRIVAGTNQEEVVHIAVIRDTTAKQRANEEMQQLQAQLFQAQKMETIGTLAGGVAHDFNNLLAGILGTASLMKMSVGKDSLLQEHIQTIEQAALRASDLTKQLLGFARAGKYEVRALKVNHLVEELMQLISRTFDKRIAVTTQLAPDLWTIEGDGNQLQHSLLNICLNARDAMPDGGALTIMACNLEIEARDAAHHFNVAPGKYVQIAVADTGIGMDTATQARIFEPFFSTKERSKGTGLGLAMVYGIIRNHGGRIHVDSAVGKGTTFHIYLPATPVAIAVSAPAPPAELPFGHGTILLVDDERVILDVASRILKQLGYSVLLAQEGNEALHVFAERRHEIALVILDMVMPKLNGREVFRRMKEIDPAVRVLLSSGYSADGDTQAILSEGVIGFVQKPYLVNDLAQAVKRALQPNGAAA